MDQEQADSGSALQAASTPAGACAAGIASPDSDVAGPHCGGASAVCEQAVDTCSPATAMDETTGDLELFNLLGCLGEPEGATSPLPVGPDAGAWRRMQGLSLLCILPDGLCAAATWKAVQLM